MTTKAEIPHPRDLTRAQYTGWACVWCGRRLLDAKARLAGRAIGSIGAVVMDVDVYECADEQGCAALRLENEQTGTN
ncbi:hypothetical protein ACIPSA_46340 [Streptomyces sp. NPDC086549]|uniref:hypothetical protein n=1 Tax=Streptomyces sp. NPDC086549 TaxID=3365752 RepID=UPI003811CDF1